MKLRTKQLLYIVLFGTALPAFAATNAIVQVKFITESHTVAPSVVSEVLTIQTQNSAGEAEKIEETADITFVSSSPTGEFLGSTGNPVTTTMSKGSANRNFYYRDTAMGTHTLTVTVRTRDSNLSWTATQQIIISSSVSSETEQGTSTASESSSSSSSTHSGSQELSEKELIVLSTLGIGRERTIPVNVPIQFTLKGSPSRGVYDWSFGDGSAGYGQSVRHTYQEAGDYVVVLNGNVQGKEIIARTTVHVYTPSVLVLPARTSHALVLKNMGITEINVGGWILESGGAERGIPRDTILLPQGRITIGFPQSFKNTQSIALYYPNRVLIARYDPTQVAYLLSAVDTYQKRNAVVATVKQTAAVATESPLSLEKIGLSSTSTPRRSLVLPLRPSWWQVFIDSVFAR